MTDEPISAAESEATEPMPLGSRLFNVYAAPGEVFESVRQSTPAHANWLVPALISILLGIVFSLVVFSQPDIVASVMDAQKSVMQARVDAGKMTQEQMEQALDASRAFMSTKFMITMGVAGAVVGTPVTFLFMGTLVFLFLRFALKKREPFLRSLELVGLSWMIYVVASLVTLLLVMLKGSINAGPNLALLVGQFDPTSYLHQLLAAINLFTVWFMIVLAVGIARISGRPTGVIVAMALGAWAVIRLSLAIASAWWTNFSANL